MKYDQEMCRRLIELVQRHPELYNSSIPQYTDQIHKQRVWKKISDTMNVKGMTFVEWKKLWKQKRDGFARSQRRLILCKDEATRKRIRNTPQFDELRFLKPHLTALASLQGADQEDDSASSSTGDEEEIAADELEDLPEVKIANMYSSAWEFFDDNSVSGIADDASPEPGNSSKHPSDLLEVKVGKLLKTEEEEEETPPNKRRKPGHSSVSSSTPVTRSLRSRRQLAENSHDDKSRLEDSETMPEASEGASNSEYDLSLFAFVARKSRGFSLDTQEWLEDEMMKLLMAAKKRDREKKQDH